jgi:hypothetical protein
MAAFAFLPHWGTKLRARHSGQHRTVARLVPPIPSGCGDAEKRTCRAWAADELEGLIARLSEVLRDERGGEAIFGKNDF